MISRKEYIKHIKEKSETRFEQSQQWSYPKYACPKCGGAVRKNLMLGRCLMSDPPIQQSLYRCEDCGFEEYLND